METLQFLPFTCAGVGSIRQPHRPLESLLHKHRSQEHASWRSPKNKDESHPDLLRLTSTLPSLPPPAPELLSSCPVSEASGGRESRTSASPSTEIHTWKQKRRELRPCSHRSRSHQTLTMSAASICSVTAVERTHLRRGTRIRAPSVDAGVYTAAAEPPGMCRIHLSASW